MAKYVSEETYFNGCLKYDSYFSQSNFDLKVNVDAHVLYILDSNK